MGYGLWDMGYGISDIGYGIWDIGYRIQNTGYMIFFEDCWYITRFERHIYNIGNRIHDTVTGFRMQDTEIHMYYNQYLFSKLLYLRSVPTALSVLYLSHKYMVPEILEPVLQYIICNVNESCVLQVLQTILLYYIPPGLPTAPSAPSGLGPSFTPVSTLPSAPPLNPYDSSRASNSSVSRILLANLSKHIRHTVNTCSKIQSITFRFIKYMI